MNETIAKLGAPVPVPARAALHRRATGLANLIISLHEGGLTRNEMRAALATRLRTATENALWLARSLLQCALFSFQPRNAGRQRLSTRLKTAINAQHVSMALSLLGAGPQHA